MYKYYCYVIYLTYLHILIYYMYNVYIYIYIYIYTVDMREQIAARRPPHEFSLGSQPAKRITQGVNACACESVWPLYV